MTSKKNLYAVILLGGSGTRFWPKSRRSCPKQFLKLGGDESLFVQTVKRIKQKISANNILIITNRDFKSLVLKDLKNSGVPTKNVLFEPQAKNTAPAILWAAEYIAKRNKEGVMCVFPSDHLIKNTKKFLRVLDNAIQAAEKQYLVTCGIVPTRPETGYGYIKMSNKKIPGSSGFVVERFVEKPNVKKAQEYLRKKVYLWNSGMFIWRADVIMKAFESLQPQMFKLVAKGINTKNFARIWKKMPSVSIDNGIMEKAKNVAVVPARNIGWSDLGSWESMIEVLAQGKNSSIVDGDVFELDCKRSLVTSEGRFVATMGLEDIVVVDTPDALLVCHKNYSQAVRDVVAYLKKNKRNEI